MDLEVIVVSKTSEKYRRPSTMLLPFNARAVKRRHFNTFEVLDRAKQILTDELRVIAVHLLRILIKLL
jgi:hypothetical protein